MSDVLEPAAGAQGSVLDRIVAERRAELPGRRAKSSEEELRWRAMERPEPRDFIAALRRPGTGVVAEVKRGSPSKGRFARALDPVRIARIFRDAGAVAISVLTSKYFYAEDAFLAEIASALLADERTIGHLCLPLLRKEFHLDRYDVLEARALGADAYLLIVKTLDDSTLDVPTLGDLIAYGQGELGMTAFVEVTTEAELESALAAGARAVGINNRDLHTFREDLATTERIRHLVPPEVAVVAASGVRSFRGMKRMRAAKVDAVLIGEALCTAADPARALRQLSGDEESGAEALAHDPD